MPAAKKTKVAKKTAGASPARKQATAAATDLGLIQLKLTKAQVAAAKQCIATSGKVRLTFKELSVKRLPKRISASDVVVD